MKNKIQIRKLDRKDLFDVATIHLGCFPNSMMTRLGKEGVRRYYEWQMESAIDLYAIGAFKDDRMVGCCFGGIFNAALSGYLNKHQGFIIKRLFLQPWLFFSPTLLKKILRALYALVKFSVNKHKLETFKVSKNNHHFGILEIASVPTARGLGVGRTLMEHSEQYARENKYKIMQLTVRPENINAT